MAFPNVASVTETSHNVPATAHNVDIPAVSTDDLLVVAVNFESGGSAITLSTPAGWTKLSDATNSNEATLGVFAKKVTAGAGATTVDFATSANAHFAAQTFRITGWYGDLANVLISSSTTGSSTAPNTGSVTPSFKGDNLYISVFGSDKSNGALTLDSAPTNYANGVLTKDPGGSSGAGATIGSARRSLTGLSAEDPGAFTMGSTSNWVGFTVTVPPAPSAGPRWRDSNNASGLTGSVTINKLSGAVSGDRLLCWVHTRTTTSTPQTITAPAGWTSVRRTEIINGSTTHVVELFTRISAGASDPATWQFTFSTAGSGSSAQMVAAYDSNGGTLSVDVSGESTASATGTTTVAPSVTPTTSPTLLVVAYAVNGTTSGWTHPPGMIERLDASGYGHSTEQLPDTSATGTRTATGTSRTNRIGHSVVLKVQSAHDMTFSGSSTSTGTVVFVGIRALAFSGGSTTNGAVSFDAVLSGTLPFAAAGSSSSSGSVVFHVPHRFIGFSGSSTSSGTVVFKVPIVYFVATGSSASSGTLVFTSFYTYITPLEVPSPMSATIREATPTTSDAQSQMLRANNTVSAKIYSLIDIDIPPRVGVGAQIIKAHLLLRKGSAWTSGAKSVTASAITSSWDAETVTYNTAPTVGDSVTVSVDGAGATGDLIEIDVTSIMQDALADRDAGSETFYGFRISTTSTDDVTFASAFATPDYRPVLKIETSVAPIPPEDLRPNGGSAVSESQPLLYSRFFDADAEDVISGIRVQVSTDESFATTDYDSGEASATSASFDMDDPPAGAAAPITLSEATTYYWRSMVRDNHGLWSDYSDAAEFEVIPKGTLTLNAPSSTSVSSPTPTFQWTFTPDALETQESVELEVEVLKDGLWRSHYLYKRTITSVTALTLPDVYALEEGYDYRVFIRVWDTIDREDYSGDRAFLEDSQTFELTGVSV